MSHELLDPEGATAPSRTAPGAVPVGDLVFQRAALVVDGTTAKHVLVKHSRTVNDTDTVLSAVSLETGAVTGSLHIKSSPDRAVTAPDGTTAVVTRSEVASVTTDGHITALTVGAANFFGN